MNQPETVNISRFEDAGEPNEGRTRPAVAGTISTPSRSTIDPRASISARRRTSSTNDGRTSGQSPSSSIPQAGTPRRSTSTDVTPLAVLAQPPGPNRQPSSYFPPTQSKASTANPGAGVLSEASAYAKSVATSLAMGPSGVPARRQSASAPPLPPTEPKVPRPLPQPPGAGKAVSPFMGRERVPSSSKPQNTVHVIASSDGTGIRYSASASAHPVDSANGAGRSRQVSAASRSVAGVPQEKSRSRNANLNGGPRLPASMPHPGNEAILKAPMNPTPALPQNPIADSRTPASRTKNNIEEWAKDVAAPNAVDGKRKSRSPLINGSPTTPSGQLPPRRSSSSAVKGHTPASPLTSPVFLVSGQARSGPTAITPPQPAPLLTSRPAQMPDQTATSIDRIPGWRDMDRPSLPLALAYPQIQASLLPNLSIDSFLSLTGASDIMRKLFTGELVGRWIMGEWNIQLDREKGRSWPNLTVWEGFRELTYWWFRS